MNFIFTNLNHNITGETFMKAGVARRIADMVANGLQPEVTKYIIYYPTISTVLIGKKEYFLWAEKNTLLFSKKL